MEAAPGRVPLRRLNRREYANAVRDLIGLDVDAKKLLPDDNVKGNFDNNATALQVSPNFIDQYIYAARSVALDAIGNRKAPPIDDHLRRRRQHGDFAAAERCSRHRPPAASSRGHAVRHAWRHDRRAHFPADGEYELTIGDMAMAREVPRMEFENTVIVLLDGKEIYRTNIGGEEDHKAIDQRLDPAVEEINGRLRKIRFKATQGSTSWP